MKPFSMRQEMECCVAEKSVVYGRSGVIVRSACPYSGRPPFFQQEPEHTATC